MFYPLIRELTDFFFKNKIIAKIIFKIFFGFFSNINRISTEFFFKYKKIAKFIFKIFFDFFSKFFFTKTLFYKFFFGENFFIEFFCRKFFFSQKYFCEDFFTILSRISFVFDVCEIMYLAKFFIRNFAYCEFFCFAILVYRKRNCKFFLRFFFQRWTWIPNLKIFLFWKKVKFSLIVLLDFFTHY